MKSFLTILFVSFLSPFLMGQCELLYQNSEHVSKTAHNIAEDPSGHIFVAGSFGTNLTLGNITLINATSSGSLPYIAKFNPSNNSWPWAKALNFSINPSSYPSLIVHEMVTDEQGNAYITGGYSGVVGFDNITLSSTKSGFNHTIDIFVAKLNSSGNFIWAKSFGSKNGADRANSIKVEASGNIYITGAFTNKNIQCSGYGSYDVQDIYIAKLSSSGSLLWQKRYAPSLLTCFNGGAGYDLDTDANGNVYFTGRFRGNFTFGTGMSISSSDADAFTAKLNSSGNALWVKTGSGSGSGNGYFIYVNSDGLFTGGAFNTSITFGNITVSSSNASSNVYVTKYSHSGTIIWAMNPSPSYQLDNAIEGIIPEGTNAIRIAEYSLGTKTLSGDNGSILSALPIDSNFFWYNGLQYTEKFSFSDFETSPSGYLLSMIGSCGTVYYDSLAVTSSCSDCGNWDNCEAYTYADLLLIKSISESQPCTDSDNDGICDADDQCPGLDDALIWTPCDDGNPCTYDDIYVPDPDCVCTGNHISGCHNCPDPLSSSLSPNPLTHQGTGQSSTNVLTLPAGSSDVQFVISDMNAVTGGNPSQRFIDDVKIHFIRENGTQGLHTYSGAYPGPGNTVDVWIDGSVQSLWVVLSDGYDGNSSVQQSISFSSVTFCNNAPAAAPIFNGVILNGIGSDVLFQNEIGLVPNPANEEVTITLPVINQGAELVLIDQLGKVLVTRQIQVGLSFTTLNLNEEIPDGIYILKLFNKEINISKRLVIAR